MKHRLTRNDVTEKDIYSQDYSQKATIEGVRFLPLIYNMEEEGELTELITLTPEGTLRQLPTFKFAQLNRVRMNPGNIKAWHLHLGKDEIWYVVPSGELFVGLWDIRKNSKTHGVTMRVVLGGVNSQLLFIPKGVAHGSANLTLDQVVLFSITDKLFKDSSDDEYRIHWDKLGPEFWLPQRD